MVKNFKDTQKPSKEELEKLYVIEKLSVKKLSERYYVAKDTIKKWILNYNINYRGFGPRKISKGFIRPSKEQLDELYNKEKLTLKEIGRKYNVTKTTIKRWFTSYGLKVRSDPSEARLKGAILPSKEQLIKDYESLSIELIAEKYGISTEPIITLLDRYAIQKRNRSQSKRLAEKTGRFVSWNKGKDMNDPKVAEMIRNLQKKQKEKMSQIRIKQSIIKKKLFLEKPELRAKMGEMGLKSKPKYANTKPEKLMRKILELEGLTKGLVEQYHLSIGNLRTRLDFAYPEHKLAIYCDGDFWHGGFHHHQGKFGHMKDGQRKEKIKETIKKDEKIHYVLWSNEWSVLRFWQYDIERNPKEIAQSVRKNLFDREYIQNRE